MIVTIGCSIFRFSSWFTNKETGQKTFAHFETGFLRVKPQPGQALGGTTPPVLFLSYMSAHNFGMAAIEEGTLSPEEQAQQKIRLTSASEPA